jgi:hypothetical protein
MSDNGWRLLRAGTGPAAIVAVDFGLARRAAGFPELAALLDVPDTILQPAVHSPSNDLLNHTSTEHIAAWQDELDARGLRVRAVLGFCAGASLAGALAAGLAGRDGADGPPVVLLDPRIVGPVQLTTAFEEAVASFAPAADAAEVDRARARVAEATSDPARLRDDPRAVVAAVGAAYEGVVRDAFRALGMDDDLPNELVAYFRAYLDYLALAAQPAVPGPPPGSTVLTSRSFPLPAGWVADRTFPVAREDLLASADTATAITELLHARA